MSGGAAEQYGEGNRDEEPPVGDHPFLVLKVALKTDVFCCGTMSNSYTVPGQGASGWPGASFGRMALAGLEGAGTQLPGRGD